MQIPKNVIQTGVSDPCHKIYMEDYVHTLLTQYRENEADFCLYGKREQEGEITYYFIYGAAKEEPGWELMESRDFALQRRIGEVTFDEKEAWAFFEDGYSAPLDGYFIFYEQNEDMQSYLIAMHQNQPGEKAVEVRHRSRGADRAESVQNDPQEPRRIRRSPMVYDLKTDRQETETGKKEAEEKLRRAREEKVIHAAQIGRKAVDRMPGRGSGNEGKRISFRVKAAAFAVLLGLCAVAVTSVNGYEDAREAGNFFAQALDELKSQNGDDGNAADSGTLIVEETRIASAEERKDELQSETAGIESQTASSGNTGEKNGQPASAEESAAETSAETFPVLSTDVTAQEETAASAGLETAVERENGGSDTLGNEAGDETGSESESLPETESAQSEDMEPAADTSEDMEQADSGGTVSYTVQRGDSLAIICRRQYGNTDRVEEIAELNRLDDPNHLIPGQKLLLPQQ